MKLTQAQLKEVLHYDPEAGVFTWMVPGKGMGVGQNAGSINKFHKYRYIQLDGKNYLASRLAWLYMEGYFPEHQIDHKNRIRHDDRWKNLRHVSPQCNSRNCSISKNNKSGITGVCWQKTMNIWTAQIMISGKAKHLGCFNSKLDAARARWKAEIKYGFPACNTTSTAYLYLRGKHAI